MRQAIPSDGIRYPVVQDNHYGTWNAYQNQYWPAEYLIDAHGQVRHTQFGEGDYKQDEAAVRQLLYEAGAHHLPPPMTAHAIMPSAHSARPRPTSTPQRAQGFASAAAGRGPLLPGAVLAAAERVRAPGPLECRPRSRPPRWPPGRRSAAGFQAAHVYLVMTSAGNVPRRVRVLLDGRPIPAADAGADVQRRRRSPCAGQRLYSLVSLPGDGAARADGRAARRASAPTTSRSADPAVEQRRGLEQVLGELTLKNGSGSTTSRIRGCSAATSRRSGAWPRSAAGASSAAAGRQVAGQQRLQRPARRPATTAGAPPGRYRRAGRPARGSRTAGRRRTPAPGARRPAPAPARSRPAGGGARRLDPDRHAGRRSAAGCPAWR